MSAPTTSGSVRDRSIDIAKGIGIILVVMGHTKVPLSVNYFVYTFHMPLFFLLAGYTFHFEKYAGRMRAFIAGKAQRLIRPYLVACAIFYPFWLLVGRHFGEDAAMRIPPLVPLKGILLADASVTGQMIFNAVLWYLPALFVSLVFFLGLCSATRSAGSRRLLALASSAAGLLVGRIVHLPWSIDIALAVQGFMLIGYELRERRWIARRTTAEHVISALVCAAAVYAACRINGAVSIHNRHYGNPLVYYAAGTLGSLMCLHVAKLVADWRVLDRVASAAAYVGRQSLTVMIFHGISFRLTSVVAAYVLHQPLGVFQARFWAVYTIVAVGIPLLIGLVLDRTVLGTVFYGPPESGQARPTDSWPSHDDLVNPVAAERARPRDLGLDIARAIGMLLVVMGHTEAPASLRVAISTFHMPVFFVISGLTFNLERYSADVGAFVRRRFARLMFPYFVSCLIFFPFWLLIGRHFGETESAHVKPIIPLVGILYGTIRGNWLAFNPLLWFLPTLFVAEIVFLRLLALSDRTAVRVALVVATSVLGFYVGRIVALPWGVDIAFGVQAYLYLGYLLRNADWLKRAWPVEIAVIALTLAGVAGCAALNGAVSVGMRTYGSIWLYYAGGILGSLLVLAASWLIAELLARSTVASALAYVGRNTLVILVFQILALKIVDGILRFGFHAPVVQFRERFWIIHLTAGIVIPLLVGRAFQGTALGPIFGVSVRRQRAERAMVEV